MNAQGGAARFADLNEQLVDYFSTLTPDEAIHVAGHTASLLRDAIKQRPNLDIESVRFNTGFCTAIILAACQRIVKSGALTPDTSSAATIGLFINHLGLELAHRVEGRS